MEENVHLVVYFSYWIGRRFKYILYYLSSLIIQFTYYIY